MAPAPTPIALLSCRDLPDWEVDDEALRAALRRRGLGFIEPAWDDPDFDPASVELCLVRTTWDYQERKAEFLSRLERIAAQTRLSNPLPVLRWNADKHYLRDLRDAGFPLAPTLWLAEPQPGAIAAFLAAEDSETGFLKPCIGACARETLRFAADAPGLAAAEAHAARLLPAEALMLQPYLPAVESEGEYSLILFGGKPSHAVLKRPVPGDYRVMDDFGGSDEAVVMAPADWRLAEAVLDFVHTRFELDAPLAYARIDLLRDRAGQLVLNEVELIEPSLFFRHDAAAGEALAEVLQQRLG